MRIRGFLTLAILASPTVLAAAVTGWVLTADGHPVAGASVALSRPESEVRQRQRLVSGTPVETMAKATTNAKGAFSIETGDGAVIDVTVTAPGHQPERRRSAGNADLGAVILGQAPLATGVVRGRGKAIAGAVVVVDYRGAEYLTKTDEAGRYSAPDSDEISWRAVIHPDFAVHMTRSRGQKMPWDVALAAGTSFTGVATGPDQKPVAGASIAIDGWPAGKSGDDGSFTLRHAPSSWRAITATAPGLGGVLLSTSKGTAAIAMAPTGRVEGSVIDTKRQPVAGALVALHGTSFNELTGTDAQGHFALAGVPAGSYRLVVTHVAYSVGSDEFVLAPSETRSRDFTAGSFAQVTGSILDPESRPVAAATVRTERPEAMSGTLQSVFTTGPDGRYSLHLPPSTGRLAAARSGFPGAKSEELKLTWGDRRGGVDITIPSGHPVSGRVIDANRRPVGGVTVQARRAIAASNPFAASLATQSRAPKGEGVLTSRDGTFTLHLEEGTYDLTFRRLGLSTAVARSIKAMDDTKPIEIAMSPSIDVGGRIVRNGSGLGGITVSASQGGAATPAETEDDGSFVVTDLREGPVTLSLSRRGGFFNESRTIEAPANDVVIELPAGGTIRGRVIDKATRQPVTAFRAGISLRRELSAMTFGEQRSFASEDGTFTIEDVGSGLARVVITAPGYAPAASGSLSIEPEKSVDDVLIEAEKGVAITGRVTAPDGTPVRGAYVREMRRQSPSELGGRQNSAMTDSNGMYSLDAMTAGDRTFEFSHRDYVRVQKEVRVEGSDVRVDVQLGDGITVAGDVVTEAGRPVADALVVVTSSDHREARTDAGGRFSIARVEPGRQSFRATKEGFGQGLLRDVGVAPGKSITITMPAGCTIYGRVTGLEQSQLSLVTVTASARGGASLSSAVDPSGNYRLDGAPPGKVRLDAELRVGQSIRSAKPVQVEVAAGETRAADVAFGGGSTISGRVTRNSTPVAGATVRFEPKGTIGRVAAMAVTAQDGSYSAHDVTDGDYAVVVYVDGRGPVTQASYTVRGSGSFDLDLLPATFQGRVLDASTGEPVRDARVQLFPTAGGIVRSGNSDDTGAFTIDYVLPARYSLIADADGYSSAVQPLTLTEGANEPLTLRLVAAEAVLIRFVDARSGVPVDGHVTVRNPSGQPVRASGRPGATTGEYRLFLQPGTYTGTAEARGYLIRNVVLTAPGSQTVAMVRGGALDIRSMSDERRLIRVVSAEGHAFGDSAPTKRGGLPTLALPPAGVTLRDIPEGTYTIQLLGEKAAVVKSVVVTVVAGETALAEI